VDESVFYFVHGEVTHRLEGKKKTNNCGKAYFTADCTHGVVIKNYKLKHPCCSSICMGNSLFQLATNRCLCTATRFPQEKIVEGPLSDFFLRRMGGCTGLTICSKHGNSKAFCFDLA